MVEGMGRALFGRGGIAVVTGCCPLPETMDGARLIKLLGVDVLGGMAVPVPLPMPVPSSFILLDAFSTELISSVSS